MAGFVERRGQVAIERPHAFGRGLAHKLQTASNASWQPRPGRNPHDLASNRASRSSSSAWRTPLLLAAVHQDGNAEPGWVADGWLGMLSSSRPSQIAVKRP